MPGQTGAAASELLRSAARAIHAERDLDRLQAWVANALADVGVVAKTEVVREAAGVPSLRVELAGDGLAMELVREDERLVITVNGFSNCTNLPQPSDYALMREELGIVRRDPVFDRTLASAAAHAYPAEQ